ncbi:MAG TPA: glycosyltransferase family 2 protein, partial [Chitinophagaceae bacterium]
VKILLSRMQKLSVVIICKNEEAAIGQSLQSLQGLTDDIVVFDNGSTDDTKNIVRKNGSRLIEGDWEGFGKTKNKATGFAKYDWVLNLDADESVDEELKNSLLNLSLANNEEVYEIKFKNFLGKKYLRFGEWGGDKHLRFFNRKKVNWNEVAVHESLQLSPEIKIKRLEGYILHYTVKDEKEYLEKTIRYAELSAEKYAAQGKRSSRFKMYIAPAFSFLKYYFFKLGFLDGRPGFICATMTSYYTFIKYARLLELNKASSNK